MEDYLAQLNESQKLPTIHKNGPVMVIAGAGSGKTRVLTYRIAYLIEMGVDPFSILALTLFCWINSYKIFDLFFFYFSYFNI